MRYFEGWLLAILVFVLPLALYIKTLAPTYIPIDSAELALCAHFWGICHPPGFPLFILIGKIFTSIFPFGSLIYQANLLSAIFGAGTVLFIYFALIELKVQKTFAFLICLFLAVSATFWEFSLSADVFTFGTFLLALSFLLIFKKRSLLAFFVLGLSASHFYISAILAPIIYWYFLESNVKGQMSKVKNLAVFGFFFALGFFPQILMYLRMQQVPEINWGHAKGVEGFVYFISRREFGSIFLLSNPALKFTLEKLFKHFYLYFAKLLSNFAVILPLLVLASVILRGFKDRRILLLLISYLVLIFVQLLLLSTIDPLGEDNPFQISKFYLSSYVPLVLLIGVSFERFRGRIFPSDLIYPTAFLAILIFIYFLANYKVNNYSDNYFSQNKVNDAMEQLPEGSIGITVSHIVYFGGLYEQKINGKFGGVTLLYFPNEKNRDGEKYHPELFGKPVDLDFAKAIEKGKSLGAAEKYVLSTIAQNLDRDIFILQGTFEEGFFNYLKPYIRPYGLWWRLETDLSAKDDPARLISLLAGFRNANIKFDDLELKQQKLDSLNYAVSYHSSGIRLAALGEYEKAIIYLKMSLAVRPAKGGNIGNEIALINRIRDKEGRIAGFVEAKNLEELSQLGEDYFTIGNFEGCAEVFSQLVKIGPQDARNFNNLASCLASLGKKQEARENYQKALRLDPNLDHARQGLKALEE